MESTLLCDDICKILGDEITSLKIRPGEALSKNSLYKRFSVSKAPVQDVLQRLQQDRFVQIISRRGTIVTPIDLDTANQLIYQRAAMETMIPRDFVKTCTPTDMARARCVMQLPEEATTDVAEPGYLNISNFLDRDSETHKIWFRATSEMLLRETLIRSQSDYSRFIHLNIIGAKNVPDVLSDYERVIEIIDSKDVGVIEGIMTHHLFGDVRRLGGQLFSEEYKDFFLQGNL